MRRPSTLFWLTALLVCTTGVLAAQSIRIVPLARDGHVLVSFETAEGLTGGVRDAIQSGLETSFTYDVELRVEVPLWIDRTIASARVRATDRYDNLTRRHHLTRELDGRIEEAVVTEDEPTMRRWLTSVERLKIFETSRLEPNRDYYVRVRARTRPQNGSLFRWGDGLLGYAKFTFIP